MIGYNEGNYGVFLVIAIAESLVGYSLGLLVGSIFSDP